MKQEKWTVKRALENRLVSINHKDYQEKRIIKNFINPEDPFLTLNVELLRKVQKLIINDYRAFDMVFFRITPEETRSKLENVDSYGVNIPNGLVFALEVYAKSRHTCFTQACIGGWTVFAKNGQIDENEYKRDSEIKEQAKIDLGLTWDQTDRLFYFKDWNNDQEGWPKRFSRRIRKIKTLEDMIHNARIAVERIEYFIQTKCSQ